MIYKSFCVKNQFSTIIIRAVLNQTTLFNHYRIVMFISQLYTINHMSYGRGVGGVEVTFYGGAGTIDLGELGGIQLLINDLIKKSKFMFDYGQPPDRTNTFYSFPYRMKQFEMAELAERLGLYYSMPNLFRHDLENARKRKTRELPLDGILLSHAHYDHAGGFSLIRHDMPIFMHPYSQLLLYIWQYTSGRTINQFVDVIQQMARAPKKYGKEKYISGEEAVLPRDIRLFESQQLFQIGGMDIMPYLVDHSLLGANAFDARTSEGRVAISGDFRSRGRRPEDTRKFLTAVKDADFFFVEGSLFHFDHYGTEEDVTDVVTELCQGKDLVAITYPPRDLDRILSLYNACVRTGRMLVIPPNQAKLLQAFNGTNGYPRLSNKYIGVLMKPKGKGRAEDEDEEFEDLIDGDYYKWERPYLKYKRWDAEEGHADRPTRVYLEDIAQNQDKFMLYVGQADMISYFNAINPGPNSLYIRSHPGPWTKEMEIQEDHIITILQLFGMYRGPQKDCLAELYLEGRKRTLFSKGTPIVHKMHQVHMTGHHNRDETRELISELNDDMIIVPYHSMHPIDFVNDVAKGKLVFIPMARQTYTLQEIRENARRAA